MMVMPAFAYADVVSDNGLAVTKAFIAEAEYFLTTSDNAQPMITLSNTERNGNEYLATTAVILPDDMSEAYVILDSIKAIKENNYVSPCGSGTITEDGWFYGSSVYLTTTLSYTTVTENGITYGEITRATISANTNSGTTISSMSLRLGQNGFTQGYGYTNEQVVEYDATTQRTFVPPSNWSAVIWGDDEGSIVGSELSVVATRSNGATSTFALYNTIIGDAG
ncbi:MAG: hypothetical protein IJB67_05650 [Firmicutes bacterium]|nr:hypothetical protein [Bacillota bacterium]